MNLIKIGIVCYPSVGGSGVVATELGNELARLGHEVHFISYETPFRLDQSLPTIFFHQVEINKYDLFKYPDYTLPLAVKLSEISETYKLDVVHVHYAVPHATAALVAKEILTHNKQHVPKIVTTLHGTDITLLAKDANLKSIIKYSIEQSDAVTTVSESLKKDTELALDVKKDVEVIANFYEPKTPTKTREQMRDELGLSGDDFVLIHLSNLRPVKRIPDLLKILSEIKEDGVKLLLLSGGDFSVYKNLVDEYGIKDRIILRENVFDIENYLNAADVGVYTSETESFGMGILETMAFGHPVVATRSGGIPEVMNENINGFLVPVGGVSGFVDAILKLYNDKNLLQSFSLNAQAHVRDKFSTKNIISKYLSLYERIIG